MTPRRHLEAMMADWNSFRIDTSHRQLLKVAFIGVVQGDKELGFPAIMGKLIKVSGIMSFIETAIIDLEAF
jgi:hypothetical protein